MNAHLADEALEGIQNSHAECLGQLNRTGFAGK